MNILIPIASADESFKAHGYRYCKSLVEINGKPMIERVYDCLISIPDAAFHFVIRRDDNEIFHLGQVLQLLHPGTTVIEAQNATSGAACTCLLGVTYIDNEQELIITNGDQLLNANLPEIIAHFRKRELDAGVIVFESVHPRWSYVRTDEKNHVVEAAEKNPISRMATAGFYYFRQGCDFVEAAKAMIRKGDSVQDGYFVCPALNQLVLKQKRIGTVSIPRTDYISLAKPEDVETYTSRQAQIRRI